MVSEIQVETHLVNRVKELGGMTAKMTIRGRAGWPDRLVALDGELILVELKRPRGGRLSAVQIELHKKLAATGVIVLVLWSIADVDRFFPPKWKTIDHAAS